MQVSTRAEEPFHPILIFEKKGYLTDLSVVPPSDVVDAALGHAVNHWNLATGTRWPGVARSLEFQAGRDPPGAYLIALGSHSGAESYPSKGLHGVARPIFQRGTRRAGASWGPLRATLSGGSRSPRRCTPMSCCSPVSDLSEGSCLLRHVGDAQDKAPLMAGTANAKPKHRTVVSFHASPSCF